MKFEGRVWKLNDDVKATDLLPAAYDRQASQSKWDECAPHVLEEVRPDFADRADEHVIFVAGKNLGSGHAHYHRGGALACRAAGVKALLADSVNGLFQRCAIDDGYLAWPIPGLRDNVNDGDWLEIELALGTVENVTQGTQFKFKPPSQVITDILEAGSSFAWAINRVQAFPVRQA
ncbi:TPA: hypothetical protein ACG4NT_000715 [Stenotrophomonas maltophilia]|uniref:hypothetical protein n=1 Tax=Stenotrophomonas TaxID=40323 RepID=UPI000D170B0C|nr:MULTISPECIES: hypothetical protein [unclassified Stenotrophomonas]PTA72727.1 hypothetical protein C9412_04525 [Stenotrophomonas sp. Nf1]PTA82448.1 hypothetical protein C9416_04535 [Stenotrophomonas sp. Nf4]